MTHFFSLPVCFFFLNSKIIGGAKNKKTKSFGHLLFKIDQLLLGKPSEQ